MGLRGNSLRCCALRPVERTGKCNSKSKGNNRISGVGAPHPEANHLGMGFFLAISVGVIEQLVKVKSL